MKRAMSFYLVFVLCLAIVPASTVDGASKVFELRKYKDKEDDK